jgi:hypothetical protein
MKPTTIKIKVADPCHENWDKMLAEEKGKFCLSCQKTVVDFSRMTNEEIIQYFEQNARLNDSVGQAGKSICGRIAKHQHDTPISNYRRVVTPWFNKYVAGFFMALGFYYPSHAQSPEVPFEQNSKGKINIKPSTLASNKPVTINGRVLDAKTKKVIKGAVITVDGTDLMAVSDKNGNYTITIPERSQSENMVLTVVRENYIDATITGIDLSKTMVSVITKMNEIQKPDHNDMIMGKMIKYEEK